MLSTIRRLASEILDVGENKIKIKSEELERAKKALTRADVKGLIKDKVIYIKQCAGFKVRNKRKKKLIGSRKGSMNARTPKKKKWMNNIRAQRKYLSKLVSEGNVDKKDKRKIYLRIKGGSFKGKKALLMFLKENNLYIEKTIKNN
ncbi:MAG: 50S ribosomal protein L19e [Candidatus Micrarchaeota archaeon]